MNNCCCFEVHFHLEDAQCNGRPMVMTEEIKEEVRKHIVAMPRISVRKLTQGAPALTLKVLDLHPCRVLIRQELKPPDPAKCLNYYDWFSKFTHRGLGVLDVFLLMKLFLLMKRGCINRVTSTRKITEYDLIRTLMNI